MLAKAIGVDAVENLSSSYGYYLDDGSWDEMANTFGAKGSKEITGAGVYAGSDRIRASSRCAVRRASAVTPRRIPSTSSSSP
ncbi:MAG: nuclear transport factor 2 family protein [Acidobacteriota bacterium]